MFFIPLIPASVIAKVARVLPRRLRMCLLLAQLYPGSLYYHSYTQKHKNALPVTQTHVFWGCIKPRRITGLCSIFWLFHTGELSSNCMLNFTFHFSCYHRATWVVRLSDSNHTWFSWSSWRRFVKCCLHILSSTFHLQMKRDSLHGWKSLFSS